eukprot:scaffold2909_cov28-Tisochrysis_lutea.AAC.1
MRHAARGLIKVEAVDALIEVARHDGGAFRIGSARDNVRIRRVQCRWLVGAKQPNLYLALLETKDNLIGPLLGPRDAGDGGRLLELVADGLLIPPLSAQLGSGRAERKKSDERMWVRAPTRMRACHK